MKREVLEKMRMASLLFTIEQFELLRRLRASGITKDQVALAFDHFDRVDWELQGILRGNNGSGRVSSMASNSPPQIHGLRIPLLNREQDRNASEKESAHAVLPALHPNGNGTNGDRENGRPKSSAQSACSVSSSNDDSSATEGRDQMTPPLQLTLPPAVSGPAGVQPLLHKSPPPHRASTDSAVSLIPPSVLAASSDSERESIQAAAALISSCHRLQHHLYILPIQIDLLGLVDQVDHQVRNVLVHQDNQEGRVLRDRLADQFHPRIHEHLSDQVRPDVLALLGLPSYPSFRARQENLGSLERPFHRLNQGDP